MEKFKSLEELINTVCEDTILDTVNAISDLYKESCDITMDILEEHGVTLSEKYLIAHVLELQSEILDDLIEDMYIEECDGDCENCSFAEEE